MSRAVGRTAHRSALPEGSSSAPPEVSLSSSAGRAVIAAAVLGSALAYMSDDMLNVALPTLTDDLGVGVTGAQWVVNGYFITMLSLMLTAGSIADIKGQRRTFLWGLAVFTMGAVVCAAAPTVPVLFAGRAVQGIGAALLLASGLALVNGSFAEDERSRAVGLYMGLTAVATAAGPVLGGLLVDLVSWRAIFVAPLVFPFLAVIVTITGVPGRDAPATSTDLRRPDIGGAVLAFATVASFSFALIRGPADWLRPDVLIAIGVSVISAVLFIAGQRRRADPMLPLGLFHNLTFLGGNIVTLISYLVSAGAFFFTVVHLQTVLGYAPARAGAALAPLYLIMLIGSPLSGRLADKIGARIPIVIGLSLLSGGIWWLSLIGIHSRYGTGILPGLVLLAIGLAILGAPLTAATLSAATDEDQGIASGVNNTVGQLAGLLMIAVLPAVAGLSGAGFEGPTFVDGYRRAMQVCVVLAIVAGVVAVFTIRPTPTEADDATPMTSAGSDAGFGGETSGPPRGPST